MAVVKKPVEDCCCDDGVPKDAAPLADVTVAGDQGAPALVALADELEEQMGGVGCVRQRVKGTVDYGSKGTTVTGSKGTPLIGSKGTQV